MVVIAPATPAEAVPVRPAPPLPAHSAPAIVETVEPLAMHSQTINPQATQLPAQGMGMGLDMNMANFVPGQTPVGVIFLTPAQFQLHVQMLMQAQMQAQLAADPFAHSPALFPAGPFNGFAQPPLL